MALLVFETETKTEALQATCVQMLHSTTRVAATLATSPFNGVAGEMAKYASNPFSYCFKRFRVHNFELIDFTFAMH